MKCDDPEFDRLTLEASRKFVWAARKVRPTQGVHHRPKLLENNKKSLGIWLLAPQIAKIVKISCFFHQFRFPTLSPPFMMLKCVQIHLETLSPLWPQNSVVFRRLNYENWSILAREMTYGSRSVVWGQNDVITHILQAQITLKTPPSR